MKRLLVLVVVLGMVVTAACSKEDQAAPPVPAQVATSAPPPPTTSTPPPPPPPATTGSPSAPAETVTGFPDYPGAVRVAIAMSTEPSDGFARKAEAKWTSTSAFAEVVTHYQKLITEGGWTATETRTRATEAEWKLTKAGAVAKIEIKQGPPLTIKVERRDR